ncbi:glycyl radical protein [Desulfitobacterium chlororespirans]|uniref:Formate C-acetyltransferase n=1 Tax=Desulfitobacterium chlororespirans DSM 11544 TaxID=1121395 RepID=A0A1M7UG31_9FIRM|nr:pyruvate formate lyase family protein [Desulfitobacterium chlororespirans]SHN81949.1 formate C-acetyltransferase [Desulfitobacterium chlororespirans DSM 11544]
MELATKLNSRTVDEERVQRLKSYLLDAPQKVDTERLKLLAEIYPKLDGHTAIVRRAKLLDYILKNKTLYIDDNFFVGSVTQYVCGVYPYPEWNCDWMKDKEGKAVSHLGEMEITAEDRVIFEEIVKYWDERSIYPNANRLFEEVYGYSSLPAQDTGLFYDGNSWPAGGGTMNYNRILTQGARGIIDEARERMSKLEVNAANTPKRSFYEAVIITMNAMINLSHRYAELARKKAAEEKSYERRQELLEIAEICEVVPEYPARTFKEALQSFLLTHLVLEIEVTGCGYSLGYWGQYMDPFYQKDLAEGRITRKEALYLTKLIFIKLQEIGYYHGPKFAKAWSSHVGQTLCIGGLTEEGRDATCEMDYICCDAHIDLKNIQPPLALFWHPGLKEDFLFKAVEVIKTGVGHPQIMNTPAAITREMDRFREEGVTLEEARRVAIFGCVGTDIANKTSHPVEGEVCIGKAFELAFNDGVDPLTGMQVGPKTGDPESFKTFDDLFEAFRTQTDFALKTVRGHGRVGNQLCAETLPLPMRSILTDGCLETGRDCWDDGAKYTADLLINVGTIDAANSLMAVKTLVYDDKKLTMAQLKEALAANFGGHEDIQKMCLDAPKHGNDDEVMNEFVHKCYDVVWEAYYKAGRNYCGKKGKPEAYSNSLHNLFGAVMGALPTGREAGLALTDGSVSAMPGSDVNGPTALVNSAAKALDTVRFNSNHFNMKFHPAALDGPRGVRNLLSLVKTYMDQGGSHIQFNVVSSKTLKDAQVQPDKYKDLVVRVAGFSAYFTRLDPGVQAEIIKRTELSFN